MRLLYLSIIIAVWCMYVSRSQEAIMLDIFNYDELWHVIGAAFGDYGPQNYRGPMWSPTIYTKGKN